MTRQSVHRADRREAAWRLLMPARSAGGCSALVISQIISLFGSQKLLAQWEHSWSLPHRIGRPARQ